jgi:hypothetical protein
MPHGSSALRANLRLEGGIPLGILESVWLNYVREHDARLRAASESVFHHHARDLDITDRFHFKHDGRKSECCHAVEIGVGKAAS